MTPDRVIPAALFACAVCVTAPLTAQDPPPAAGPLLGIQMAFSVSTAVGGTPEPEILWKEAGFYDAAPTPRVPEIGQPDFRIAAILGPSLECGIAKRNREARIPDVDAMSIGLDWINTDATGKVQIAGDWGALTYSVSASAVGDAGSVVAGEAGTTLEAGSDIFSYVLPGSTLVGWVDETTKANDAIEINVSGNPSLAEQDAQDYFMTLFELEGTVPNPTPLPLNPWFYFSVSPASVETTPDGWWQETIPSAATILRCQWTGSEWTCPEPFLLYSDLGLAWNHDVDALAVDEVRGWVLFSTADVEEEQLRLVDLSNLGVALDYVGGPTRRPLGRRAGLRRSDNIDAVCSLDPGSFLNGVLGTPRPPAIPTVPFQLGLQVYRRLIGGQAQLTLCMNGWPPGGPNFGQVQFVYWDGPPGFPGSNPTILQQLVRDPLVLGPGGALHWTLPIQPTWVGMPAFFEVRAQSQGVPGFDLSFPVELQV